MWNIKHVIGSGTALHVWQREIARHLHVDNTVQQHVRDHLSDFVAVRPRRRSGTLYALGGGKEPYGRLWFEPLYVDSKDGLLKRTDRLREAEAFRRARRVRSASPDRIGSISIPTGNSGVSMACGSRPLPTPEYRAFPEVRKIPLKRYVRRSPVIEMEMIARHLATPAMTDVVSGALVAAPKVDEERAWAEYRRAYPDRRHAVAKRALSRAELRRHALSNLLA